jgi:hypothetical protein
VVLVAVPQAAKPKPAKAKTKLLEIFFIIIFSPVFY